MEEGVADRSVCVSNQHWWVNLCMHVLVTDGVLSGRNSYTGSRLISLLQPSVARATHIWLLVVRDYKWARERERDFSKSMCGVCEFLSYCVYFWFLPPLFCETDPSFYSTRRGLFTMASPEREHKKVKKIYPSVTFVVRQCASLHGSLILSWRSCRDGAICISGVCPGRSSL